MGVDESKQQQQEQQQQLIVAIGSNGECVHCCSAQQPLILFITVLVMLHALAHSSTLCHKKALSPKITLYSRANNEY